MKKKNISINISSKDETKSEIVYNNVISNMDKMSLTKDEQIEYLKSLGYKHTGFNLKHENMQPRWAFALDLKDWVYLWQLFGLIFILIIIQVTVQLVLYMK